MTNIETNYNNFFKNSPPVTKSSAYFNNNNINM